MISKYAIDTIIKGKHDEPKILVHSTTPTEYSSIIKGVAIKSWNLVKVENSMAEDIPIGALLNVSIGAKITPKTFSKAADERFKADG